MVKSLHNHVIYPPFFNVCSPLCIFNASFDGLLNFSEIIFIISRHFTQFRFLYPSPSKVFFKSRNHLMNIIHIQSLSEKSLAIASKGMLLSITEVFSMQRYLSVRIQIITQTGSSIIFKIEWDDGVL